MSYKADYAGDANYPARSGACEPLSVQTSICPPCPPPPCPAFPVFPGQGGGGGPCSLNVLDVSIKGTLLEITIQNTSTGPGTLKQFGITWPDRNGGLKSVSMDGYLYTGPTLTGGSAMFTDSMLGPNANFTRTIAVGQSQKLRIHLREDSQHGQVALHERGRVQHGLHHQPLPVAPRTQRNLRGPGRKPGPRFSGATRLAAMPTYRYLIVGGGMTAHAACRGIREHDARRLDRRRRRRGVPALQAAAALEGALEGRRRGLDLARHRPTSASSSSLGRRDRLARPRRAHGDRRPGRVATATSACCSRPAAGRAASPPGATTSSTSARSPTTARSASRPARASASP